MITAVPHLVAGLAFPPIGELLDWKSFGPGGFNKTALIDIIAVVLTLGLFISAVRRKSMVPRGVQNLAESLIDFVNGQIIMETIGVDGLAYMPLILSIFCFVFICNIFEIIPFFQFPADARMANPLILALIVWGTYNYAGVKHQGLGGYIKNSTIPPGVPKALIPLVALIEGAQRFVLNPITLAIRLFANMLAGHLLLVTFALMADALFFHNTVTPTQVIGVLPVLMEIVIIIFEVLIAVLQAFIFAILTGVYLGPSLHPEH